MHSAASVVALGLGIGLTTTVFSIVYGGIYRPLPYESPGELLHLETNNPSKGWDSLEVSLPDFEAWRAHQTSFEALAANYSGTMNLSGDRRPERYEGAFVSANTFTLLRVRPLLGRDFRPGEDRYGAPALVLLNHTLWQTRYGADPAVVGRAIRLNGEPATIIGVMPAGFTFPGNENLWTNLRLDPAKNTREEGTTLEVIGRLKAGLTLERAAADIATITRSLEQEYPATNRGVGSVVKPLMEEFIGAEVRGLLFTMLGAVLCVLLIACANVANLMLVRASSRVRELAIRSALGAGRARVIAQILLESFLLAGAGALLGLGLALWGVRAFNAAIVVTEPPSWLRFEIDWAAPLFVVAAGAVAGLLSGLVAALRAAAVDLNHVLKDEGRGTTSLRLGRIGKGIVIAEVALSCVLLILAGLLIKSVLKVQDLDLGFDRRNLLTVRIALFDSAYPTDADRARFFERLPARLEGRAGVVAAGLTSALPTNGSETEPYAVEGQAYASAADLPRAHSVSISPEYLQTLGLKLRAGRGFTRMDTMQAESVVIVNQAFARKVWPEGDPIGQRIRIGAEPSAPWRRVVGVIRDLKEDGLIDATRPEAFYVPLAQSPRGFMSLVVRTQGPPLALVPLVRAQVAALDPDLPIYFVYTMAQVVNRNAIWFNVFGVLFTSFGVAALLLAAVGIYGVLAFSVSQRTQELGVRMALGARARDVLGLVLGQGARQLAIGLGIGLVLAVVVSRLMTVVLFDVQPSDPQVFATTIVLLSGATLLACLLPALRAARIEPVEALRYE